MFKNFGAVYRFTLKNQAMTKSYIRLTVTLAVIFLLLPGIIMLFASGAIKLGNKDKEVPEFTADTVYVVDYYANDVDFSILAALKTKEDLGKIKYISKSSVEEALEAAKAALQEGKNPLVLKIEKEEGSMGDAMPTGLISNIIIPEGSEISKDEAERLYEVLEENETLFVITAAGMKITDLAVVNEPVSESVYTQEGYRSGSDVFEDKDAYEARVADQIKSIFEMIVVYLVVMMLYFLIIMYGSGVTQSVVLEKQNKLMDTMLVSVKPEAMVMGKLLAVGTAGVAQSVIWILTLVIGVVGGNAVLGMVKPEKTLDISIFLNSIGELGVFRPLNMVLAVLTIAFGFMLYLSLAGVAGAISSNQEETASNSYIFVMVLLASFMIAMFGGVLSGNKDYTWMYFVPSIAVLILPAGFAAGTVSLGVGIVSFLLIVIVAGLITIAAGRLYKMMSLYKGDAIKLGKALKMLFTNK